MPLPARIPRNLPKHVHKKREGMSRTHVADMHALPCLACGALKSVQAHHLLRTGEHGGSLKSTDRWCVPLCFRCHDPNITGSVHHHGNEDAWFAERGIDGRAIAAALWRVRGDPGAMLRIVARSLNGRRIYVDA